MNRNELVTKVSRSIELPKSVVDRCLTGFISEITATLIAGENAKIHEFGTFMITERQSRKGIIPATQELIDIPATNKVRFKPSPCLNAIFNGGND